MEKLVKRLSEFQRDQDLSPAVLEACGNLHQILTQQLLRQQQQQQQPPPPANNNRSEPLKELNPQDKPKTPEKNRKKRPTPKITSNEDHSPTSKVSKQKETKTKSRKKVPDAITPSFLISDTQSTRASKRNIKKVIPETQLDKIVVEKEEKIKMAVEKIKINSPASFGDIKKKKPNIKEEAVVDQPIKIKTPKKLEISVDDKITKPTKLNIPTLKTITKKKLSVTVTDKAPKKTPDKINQSLNASASKKDPLTKRNRKGETLLHAACVAADCDKVKSCLLDKCNPNTKDYAGWSPLHEAVSNGRMDIVKLLLENGAFPSIPGPMNETPLHEAARINSEELCKILLKHHANIFSRNHKGLTPYDLANDHLKLIMKADRKEKKIEDLMESVYTAELTSEVKIYCIALTTVQRNLLKKLMTKFPNLMEVQILTDTVTFVLMNNPDGDKCSTSQDTLTAVLLGIPIINTSWLEDSSSETLGLLKNHAVAGLGSQRECLKLSHLNRLMLFPRLFDGCHFYFLGFKTKYEISSSLVVNKQILSKFVTDGGGTFLKREPNPELIPASEQIAPFHILPDGVLANCSHYIIYAKKPELAYNMTHIKSLPVGWFIECIQNFRLIDP